MSDTRPAIERRHLQADRLLLGFAHVEEVVRDWPESSLASTNHVHLLIARHCHRARRPVGAESVGQVPRPLWMGYTAIVAVVESPAALTKPRVV